MSDGFDNDYGRSEIGGMNGPIKWESLLEGDGLDGWENQTPVWSRDGETIVVASEDSGNVGPLERGDSSWESYELKTQITMHRAPAVQIGFRISDAGRYVFQFLNGWKCACICSRNESGLSKLDVVDFPVEAGREYDLVIAAREKSIVTYIDGVLINRLTDDTYQDGGVAIGIWGKNSNVLFRDPKIRHYS
jgi:hypothetical protein